MRVRGLNKLLAVHRGKKQPISLCKPRVTRMRGPSIVEELFTGEKRLIGRRATT